MTAKKTIAFCIFLFFVISKITAQNFPRLRFKHLGEKDGLPENAIIHTTQDKRGFIWFGTENGLSRYDGYRFKTFYHSEKDSNSIPSNIITAIKPADNNHMWITTKKGLAWFNTLTYKSKNILHKDDNPATIRRDEDVNVYSDENKNNFLTTYEGLYKLNNNFSVIEIPQGTQPFQFFQETKKYCTGIFKDRAGNLWSVLANRIYLLDAATKKIKQSFTAPFTAPITNLYFDDDNTCWITTWGENGVYKFNTGTHHFTKVYLGQLSIIGRYITHWTINNKKYIVLCSLSNGMYLIDPISMQYKCYLNDEFGRPLLSTHINHAFIDKQNILWLATNNGVQYISPSTELFEIIPIYLNKEDTRQNMIDGRVVKNFFETDNGYWISKWHNSGTFFYNKSWQLQKHWQGLYGRNHSLNPTSQTFFTLNWKNNLYFSTDSGLVQMNPLTYQTKLYLPTDTKYPPDFRNIVMLNDSLWLVRSHGYGIFVFDAARQKFVKHYQNKDSCSNCLPISHYEFILKDKRGTIWISTENGLFEYIPSTDNFKAWRRNDYDSISFPSNKLSGMAEDADGNLWIGTIAGICMFNPVLKKVEKVFEDNTYISVVFRVCVDDYQNIWFNSRTGIWCWLRKQNKLLKFGDNVGIPGGFEIGVMEKTKDGSIYAGCTDALIKFNPKKLMEYKENSEAKIADASIDNKQAFINFGNPHTLKILPGQQIFTVDFTVLNYDIAENNQYYYRLLPQSKEWIENNTGHLNFYNLPPGNYQLEVKGKNKLSNAYSAGDVLHIIVKPNWYQTNGFKILSVIAFAGLVFYFVKRRIENIRNAAALKQKIAETEMQALRAQMNPHFIFNSLNSIENFIMQNEKRLASDYLNKFSRLIRIILESNQESMVPISADMEALQLYIELEQLRFKNKFTYQTNIDEELLNGDYRVPPLLIQPFVENAILHGIAHSDKPTNTLTINAGIKDEYVNYIIEDNGIGRKKAADYNFLNKPNHKSVGLYITQERIELHNIEPDKSLVKITDLFNTENEPAGTRVEVNIKIK